MPAPVYSREKAEALLERTFIARDVWGVDDGSQPSDRVLLQVFTLLRDLGAQIGAEDDHTEEPLKQAA